MKIKKVNKLAKKQGKRDGKNEIPRQSWKEDSVPFFSQLNKQFKVEIHELLKSFEAKQQQIIRKKNELDSRLSELQGLADLSFKELEAATENVKIAKDEIDGTEKEAPVSRFSRTRLVAVYLYLPILFFLGIAEYLITVPALEFLLGEKGPVAALVASCISVASIGYAHIMGASLKVRLDRAKPQIGIATLLPIGTTVLIFLTVAFLSYIRGAYTSETAGNLAQMSEDFRIWFLTAMYTVLQLTFISIGLYLAFLHHSEIESKRLKTQILRTYWDLKLKRYTRKIETTSATLEKINQAIHIHQKEGKAILSREIKKVVSLYEESCAIYRSSNIHARKDELDGSHIALKEQKIDEKDFHQNLDSIGEGSIEMLENSRLEILSR